MIEEFEEVFSYPGGIISGIFTEFDFDEKAGEPGVISRVARLLIDSGSVDYVKFMAVNLTERKLVRLATGDSYEVKNPRLSGVGITELDLHLAKGAGFERRF